MSDKYAAMGELVDLRAASGSREAEMNALRSLAARYPGALREAELVQPSRIRARALACADALAHGSARSRDSWRATGEHGVVLWASLHERIREQMQARRATRGLTYVAFHARLDRATREHWASPAHFGLRPAHRVDVRTAYLCVAYGAGLSMAELCRCLLERQGAWDHAAEDPAWSRGHELG